MDWEKKALEMQRQKDEAELLVFKMYREMNRSAEHDVKLWMELKDYVEKVARH